MRTSIIAAALFAGAAIPLATPVAAQSTAAVDRATAAWGRITSLRAGFQQAVTNPLTGRTETARGEYQQQGRTKLAVRFTDPAGDRIVADGKHLWLYLPSTTPGQVLRSPVGDGAGGVDVTAQFLSSPKTRFTITAEGSATVAGRAADVLLLVPKRADDRPFARAKVWVDAKDGLIRQFEVTDGQGLTRKVTLTDVQVNAKVDPAAFRFTPPKGVRVVDR
jgi:chaperone LolA